MLSPAKNIMRSMPTILSSAWCLGPTCPRNLSLHPSMAKEAQTQQVGEDGPEGFVQQLMLLHDPSVVLCVVFVFSCIPFFRLSIVSPLLLSFFSYARCRSCFVCTDLEISKTHRKVGRKPEKLKGPSHPTPAQRHPRGPPRGHVVSQVIPQVFPTSGFAPTTAQHVARSGMLSLHR